MKSLGGLLNACANWFSVSLSNPSLNLVKVILVFLFVVVVVVEIFSCE